MIDFIKEKVQLKDKDDVIKLHIIIKCYEKGYNLSLADICSLVELSKSGYNETFFENCLKQKIYKSEQTIRNAIAKMTNLGILTYSKRGERKINKEFIPDFKSDRVIFQYLIGNP